MMRCYACGRVLMRAAATVKTGDGEGSLGPACAIKAGLKQKPMPRIFTVRRRPRRSAKDSTTSPQRDWVSP